MEAKMKFGEESSNGVINPREAWEREAWSVERSKVKNSGARKFQLTPLSGIAADKNDPARPFSRFTLHRFTLHASCGQECPRAGGSASRRRLGLERA